jgi:hypothetical protein
MTGAHLIAAVFYFARALLKTIVIGGLVILTPILLVAIFFVIKDRAPSEPPQQSEQGHEPRTAQIRRFKDLCSTKTLCEQFASTRQACATAGNFKTCMSIKMADFSTAQDECNVDGTLIFQPADLPNYFECLFYALK